MVFTGVGPHSPGALGNVNPLGEYERPTAGPLAHRRGQSGPLPLRKFGHARIPCAFPDGVTLKVALDFQGCAEVQSEGDVD